jgi:two-component system sensor histidine kinase CpxA
MRIFTRIFLTFWLTVVALMALAVMLVIVSSLERSNTSASHRTPIQACALSALIEYQRGGRDALANNLARSGSCAAGIWLRAVRDPAQMDRQNSSAGQPPATDKPVEDAVWVLPFHTVIAFPDNFGTQPPSILLLIRSPYVLFVKSSLSPRSLLFSTALRCVFVAAVSGLCCYLLTLYLLRPVRELGQMAEQLGGGDLRSRIDSSLTRRQDELGDLSRKFNQMANEIESLVTRQRQFLAQASHELGSPLTRVNIALGLARKKAGTTLQTELDRIGQETIRLNTLVQELLLLARLESGNELDRQTEEIDVDSLVKQVCTDANFEASQLGKSVDYDIQHGFRVLGYRELLRRSFDNVLRNGLRFAREGGSIKVTVSYRAQDRMGLISIHDDGPGISPDQEEMIFEPFVTLPDRVTGLVQGSGLGLAIARQAVIANGGRIHARNSERGGLIVMIELPTL